MTAALVASANNAGENGAWQFQTPAHRAAQAAVQAMIQQKRSGGYAAPNYTTNIGHQYNCNLTATAQGNQGTNSTLANAPSISGAGASSTGNGSSSQGFGTSGSTSTGQANTGSVGSSVNGSTTSNVQGTATQALNSNQSNTGNQTAQVGGSSACAFGVLN
ncbi:hypothetical protein QTI66_36360 [Variovorax sp. J22R133]|uniref:hypothetical protein n=1 Tax=Variovorax brevis TaxID=3053503 RepID=UPI0025774CD7|nr:hypothetical protein [Variovorax sp. J22R133]MDM0117588.1 hypothetical protein [Variovorax sp. J22R133]